VTFRPSKKGQKSQLNPTYPGLHATALSLMFFLLRHQRSSIASACTPSQRISQTCLARSSSSSPDVVLSPHLSLFSARCHSPSSCACVCPRPPHVALYPMPVAENGRFLFFSDFCSTGKAYRVIGVRGRRAAERDREKGRGLPVWLCPQPCAHPCVAASNSCVCNHAPISYALFGKQ
jgi:hypothetical protein